MLQLLRILHISIKYSLHLPMLPWVLRALLKAFSLLYFYKWYKMSAPQRMRRAVEEMGIIYIKFAQHISGFTDLIGNDMAHELSKLRDRMPTVATNIIIDIVQQSLGAQAASQIQDFSLTPIGSASIAQVHSGYLITKAVNLHPQGKHRAENLRIHVAIKVIKPGVRKQYKRDMHFMYSMAKICKNWRQAKRFNLLEVVRIFDFAMQQELDLLSEGSAMMEMSKCRIRNLVIPKLYWDFCSSEVLTMSFLEGVNIASISQSNLAVCNSSSKIGAADVSSANNLSGKNIKHCSKAIVKNLASIFFQQAYEHGFFHADMHPGNIFVMSNQDIGLVDFGITCHLRRKDRLALAQILQGFIERDYIKVAKVHAAVGYISPDVSIYAFARSLRILGESIIGRNLSHISIAHLLQRIFKVTEAFQMQVQPQLILVQKTTLSVERLVRSIDPDANPWELARPWIRSWAVRNISPAAVLIRMLKQQCTKLFGINAILQDYD